MNALHIRTPLLRAPAAGVWPADIDTDGDLDLVLAPRDGHPIVLRNNGDGTFTPRDLFPSVSRARGFAWADFDGEGVPDAAFLDEAGRVEVFLNLRGGRFRAEGQYHPATVHWSAPDGSVGWLRLRHAGPLSAGRYGSTPSSPNCRVSSALLAEMR